MGNAPDEARKRVDQLQDQQQQLLAQIRRDMALLPPPDPRRDTGTAAGAGAGRAPPPAR